MRRSALLRPRHAGAAEARAERELQAKVFREDGEQVLCGGDRSALHPAVGMSDREIGIQQRVAPVGEGARGAEIFLECRIGVCAGKPVRHFEIDGKRRRWREGIHVAPGVVDQGLVSDRALALHETARLKTAGLRDIKHPAQRSIERHAAETDIGETRPGVGHIDPEKLVDEWRLHFRRDLPADPPDQGGDGEAECAQHRGEQGVVFETITTAAIMDEFPLDREEVDGDAAAKLDVEILEGNRLSVVLMDAVEGRE